MIARKFYTILISTPLSLKSTEENYFLPKASKWLYIFSFLILFVLCTKSMRNEKMYNHLLELFQAAKLHTPFCSERGFDGHPTIS